MKNKVTIGISAFALAVGLAACSGDGEDQSAAEDQQQTEEQQAGEEQAAGEQQPEPAQTNFDNIPDIVATINGEDVSKDDFIASYEQSKQSQMMMGGEVDPESTEVDETIKDQSIDMLVSNELLIQASNNEGIEVSQEEIDAQLEQLMAMYQIESEDALADILSEQDVTVDDFKAEIGESMKPQKFLEQEAQIEDPTDEEIQARYDEMTASIENEEEKPSLDETRDDIVQQLKTEQANEAAPGIIDELREQGEVEIFV